MVVLGWVFGYLACGILLVLCMCFFTAPPKEDEYSALVWATLLWPLFGLLLAVVIPFALLERFFRAVYSQKGRDSK